MLHQEERGHKDGGLNPQRQPLLQQPHPNDGHRRHDGSNHRDGARNACKQRQRRRVFDAHHLKPNPCGDAGDNPQNQLPHNIAPHHAVRFGNQHQHRACVARWNPAERLPLEMMRVEQQVEHNHGHKEEFHQQFENVPRALHHLLHACL